MVRIGIILIYLSGAKSVTRGPNAARDFMKVGALKVEELALYYG